jgi:hypothetical protein
MGELSRVLRTHQLAVSQRRSLRGEPEPSGRAARGSVRGVRRIPPGRYHWTQYRLEVGTAQKRRLYTQVTWWFGEFYDGTIDQIIWTGAWNPTALFTIEFTGERNIGRLPSGDFDQTLIGNRIRLNVSPDLSVASYVQYDTITDSVGVNTRLRWTFRPEADLFIVYNHNIRSVVDRWQLDSNQLVMKVQYAWRR